MIKMNPKMNSSLRFPENRRLSAKVDSFLIDPRVYNDFRRHMNTFTALQCDDAIGNCRQNFPLPQSLIIGEPTLDWSNGAQNIKECLQKQIRAQKKCIKMNEKQLHKQHTALKRLVHFAKVSPMLASEAISESNGFHHWLSKERLECVASISGDVKCKSTALPYSKFCLQHILLDDKQMLYKQCTAIDTSTSKQCQKPILEILQDKPYCKAHMRLAATQIHELKKTSSKLGVPTSKGSSGKRKRSPSRVKKVKITETAKATEPREPRVNPPPLSLSLQPSLAEPILTQASSSPHSATWNTSDNDSTKKIHEIMGDGSLLPMTPTDMSLSFAPHDTKNDVSLLPFSPDAVNSFPCPPLPPAPQVGLLPLGSTLMGNILDSSSDDETGS